MSHVDSYLLREVRAYAKTNGTYEAFKPIRRKLNARNGRSRIYRVTLYETMGHVLIETASDSQWYRFADDKTDDVKAVLALIGEMADCSKTLVNEPERRGELDDKLDELKERCIELITDYDD